MVLHPCLDPDTYLFGGGGYVKQGQDAGQARRPSRWATSPIPRTCICATSRFTARASAKVNMHSLFDPLYCFDWKDTVAAHIQPLIFVPSQPCSRFAPTRRHVTVKRSVDVLATITDRPIRTTRATSACRW